MTNQTIKIMIRFYIAEAFRIFTRSPFAAMIVISITTIAILLTSISFYIVFISFELSNRLKKNIELVAYLQEPIDSIKLAEAKNKILEFGFISSVKHISKEDALKEFVKDTGEDITSVLDVNPLPQSFVIKLKPEYMTKESIENEVQTVKSVEGISDVNYENEFVVRLLRYLKSGQLIVYGVSVLLIMLSIYLVYVYGKLQFTADEKLYRTMKLVGAKLSTLKLPILIYGIMIGLFAGIITLGINIAILYFIKSLLRNINISFVVHAIYIISISMGIILGFLGSYLSAKKITLAVGE